MTKKLKTIFAISIPLFIVHGLEEYFSGYYIQSGFYSFVFEPLGKMTNPESIFWLFQIMFLLLLIISSLLLISEKWRLRVMIIPGLVYLFEIQHLLNALVHWGYYPGAITAIAYPIIAFFFWQELIENLKY